MSRAIDLHIHWRRGFDELFLDETDRGRPGVAGAGRTDVDSSGLVGAGLLDGFIYVRDAFEDVDIFSGQLIGPGGAAITSDITGMAFQDDEDIIVATAAGDLYRLPQENYGEAADGRTGVASGFRAVAMGRNDDIVAAGGDGVVYRIYPPDLSVVWSVDVGEYMDLNDVAVAPNGEIVVAASGGDLYRIQLDGTKPTLIYDTSNPIVRLSTDIAGNIFISEQGRAAVVKIDREGVELAAAPAPANDVEAVAVLSDGRVTFSDVDDQQVLYSNDLSTKEDEITKTSGHARWNKPLTDGTVMGVSDKQALQYFTTDPLSEAQALKNPDGKNTRCGAAHPTRRWKT